MPLREGGVGWRRGVQTKTDNILAGLYRTSAYAGFSTSFGRTPSQKHRAAQEHRLWAYYSRCQDEEVSMDRSYSANVIHSPTKSCPHMDPRWPQEERQTRGDLGEDCGAGNKRTGMDLRILFDPLRLSFHFKNCGL